MMIIIILEKRHLRYDDIDADDDDCKWAIEDREAHLHRGHGVVFEPIERLHGGVVAKADGGEGDEAEVGGSGGGPDGDDDDDGGGDDDPDQPSQEAKRMAPMKMNPKMSIRLTMMGTITCITTIIITITKIVTITRSVGMYRSFPISSKPIPRDLENS